ncbi:hypothetical protein [Vagococcus sp.]|uniref:hypothetical protein n=1 Tax=Vagococcus sp. TaxID=1933889 RepID=UPI002FCAE1D3
MTNLEWVFLITFIGALISILSAVTFLAIFVVYQKKYKNCAAIKSKSKSKRRKQKKELLHLKKVKKRNMVAFICFLMLSLGLGAGTAYTSYYQAVNLSKKDSEAVVKAYYLLEDFDKQLKQADKGEDKEKTSDNLRLLAGSMASYGTYKASYLNKEEGQILLNRYYNIVKEIGINASNQSQDFIEDKELIETFQKDIKKAQNYQEEVFKFYKVDKKSLAKEV